MIRVDYFASYGLKIQTPLPCFNKSIVVSAASDDSSYNWLFYLCDTFIQYPCTTCVFNTAMSSNVSTWKYDMYEQWSWSKHITLILFSLCVINYSWALTLGALYNAKLKQLQET
jgi:hypothetical protein